MNGPIPISIWRAQTGVNGLLGEESVNEVESGRWRWTWEELRGGFGAGGEYNQNTSCKVLKEVIKCLFKN